MLQGEQNHLSLHHLLIQLPSILIQLRQGLVAVLEELSLGLHQRQHLTFQGQKKKKYHSITCLPCNSKQNISLKIKVSK